MRIIVIGGGAAGMMAAYAAAVNGADVTLFEGNEKLGKKLYITGKGRCNITNSCDIEDFFSNIPTNSKFLYSALYTFTNNSLIELLNKNGLETKVERGGRVFPESDKSSDVIKTLCLMLKKAGVDIRLNDKVKKIIIQNGKVTGVLSQSGEHFCNRVIISTGGLSYPATGCTGEGHELAKTLGHTITSIEPSLVALTLREQELASMAQGLSLKNVKLTLISGKRNLFAEQGEMLFTHFGASGPLVLSASAHLTEKNITGAKLIIDLKPALDRETLDKRILRDFEEYKNRQLKNALFGLMPKSLAPAIIKYSGLDEDKFVHDITRAERERLLDALKGFTFSIHSKRSLKEAIITRGGVNVREISPATMESKIIKGVYFAGELLDVDGYTGGYNLQIAFSTGYLAGLSSASITDE